MISCVGDESLYTLDVFHFQLINQGDQGPRPGAGRAENFGTVYGVFPHVFIQVWQALTYLFLNNHTFNQIFLNQIFQSNLFQLNSIKLFNLFFFEQANTHTHRQTN